MGLFNFAARRTNTQASPSNHKPRPRHRVFVRAQAVLQAQRKLESNSYPRLQMTLIAALTGGFGLLSSFVLLHQGLEDMAWRYPLALTLAYGMFLFLIWLWLRTHAQDYVDLPDFIDDVPSGGGGTSEVAMQSGGGGDFGGGGASASFDGPVPITAESADPVRGVGETVSAAADADEFSIPLLVIALALGLALASFYVIYIAPALLAEVLVDSALSYALYRYLRGDAPGHWLATAVRRTILPFLATACFLAIMGAAMSAYAPGARSIGEVVHRAAIAK